MKFCVVRDDDGHSYIIPAAYRDEWDRYLERVRRAANNVNIDWPDYPEWVREIDGAFAITFDSYEYADQVFN